MKPVTDPGLLAQLEGDITSGSRKPVTDPALLAELNGKPKRDIGAGEAFGRGAGQGFAETGNVLALAAAAPAMAVDWVGNLFRNKPSTAAQDFVFRNVVDPTRDAVRYYEPDQNTEQMGAGATVANVGGKIASMVPSMVAAGGAAPGVVSKIVSPLVQRAVQGAVVAQPSFAVPATVTRAQDLAEGGVDGDTVAKASIANWLTNTLMGAAPVAKAGGLAARATTGAAINAASGAGQRAIEGEILGPQNERMAQPVFGEPSLMDAGIGAVMGGLFGGRPAPARRAPPPSADMNLPGDMADFARYRPILEANGITDPTAAQMAIAALKAREARIAEQQSQQSVGQQAPTPAEQLPWLRQPEAFAVDSQGRATPATVNGGRVVPEGVTSVTPEGSAKVGVLAAEAARAAGEAQAGRAFDVADAQARRKQQGQDDAAMQGGQRDLREARAGGTTTAEGTAATAPESFTFLDVQRDRTGRVRGTGPQVEIVETGLTMKVGDKDVAAVKIRTDQGDAVVEASRVSDLSRPKNPRYAQDIAASTYSPPAGVGTGDQQPQPRRAAQRITTGPSPEFIPAGDQTRGDLPGRPVNTVDGQSARVADGQPLPPPDTVMTGGSRVPQDRTPSVETPAQARQRVRDMNARGSGDVPYERVTNLTMDEPAQSARVAATDATAQGGSKPSAEEPPVTTDSRAADPIEDLRSTGRAYDFSAPDVRAEMERMAAHETGHSEVGGRLLRDADGNVTGRTTWIPRGDWWQGRPDPKRMNEQAVKEAIRKAMAGEPLSAREQRMVDYMGERAQRKINEDLALQDAGGEATPENLADLDLVSRASEIDESAVERAATQFENDDAGFMRAIREIVDGKTVTGENAGQGRAEPSGKEGGAGEGTVGAADQPGQRGRPSESGPADFGLEQPTESGLRADAERRRAADAALTQRENAPAPEDFTLTGSDRPADQARARGQTELYSNPIGPVAEAVGKALGWFTGDAAQWGKSASDFIGTLKDVKNRVPSPEGNPVLRFGRWLLDSASGDMRSVASKFNSPTLDGVIDHFHHQGGGDRVTGETYQSAVAAWTNRQVTRLDKAISAFASDSKAMEQIANLVRNPAGINKNTPMGKAANEIRAMLDDALGYMRKAGVDVGEVKGGYFPREYDLAKILANPTGFIDAVERAYRDAGTQGKAARMAAEELHDSIVYGETSSLFKPDKTNSQAPFLKGRVFGKEVDRADHPLNKFLVNDPALALPIYFQRAARRAEIARRFGDRFSDWDSLTAKIKEEGGGAAIQKLTDFVNLAAGLKAPGASNLALRASSMMRTWGSLMFLEKATLSSLTEFIVPAIRSGNVMDVARSLKNTIADLVPKMRTASADERRAFAEDLGIITSNMHDTISAARFSGGEPVSMAESKILDKYFRRTGLTQWTDATRIAAVDVGRVFVRRLAKQMDGGGKLPRRYLAELGVPESKVDDFAKFVNGGNDGMPQPGQLTGEMGDLYRSVLRRFVNQSIMSPDATLRPSWMKSPFGSLAGQLQAFNYAFYENVLKRNMRLAKEAATGADYSKMERAQMLMPTMMMPMLVAAAYVVGEGRDALLGDPARREEETTGDKVVKAVSRGMPIAPLDPMLNYITSARYQRGAADFAAGPVLGTAFRGMDAARNVAFNNSEKTNTAERQAAKALYDLFVEPTVNLALAGTPVVPLTAAATQIVGSGGTRENLFIEPLAGEKKQGRQSPRFY